VSALRCCAWLGAGVALLAAVHVGVEEVAGGFPRSQGAGVMPSMALLEWLSLWMFGGSLALAACAWGLWLLFEPAGRVERLQSWWRAGSDAAWLAAASLLAVGLALLVRGCVIRGIDLTADESEYRIAARLLLIGDPYTLRPSGGSLLLAPFVALGAPGLAAPLALAGTVPALFFAVRVWVGSGWARLAALLLATSPLAVMVAATQLDASASLLLASWATWATLRARQADSSAWAHALLGITLALGLVTQPLTFAGLGLPLLVAWVASNRRRFALARTLAVAAPVLAAGAALLLTHGRGQESSPDAERLAVWRPFVLALAGVLRLSTEALGWPVALAPALLALRAPGAPLLMALLIGVLLANGSCEALGLDLLGPTRIHAGLLPAIALTVLGLRQLAAWNASRAWTSALASMVAAALLVTSIGYTRVRLHALSVAAEHLRAPIELTAGLQQAVVFVPDGKYAPWCEGQSALTPTPQQPSGDPRLRDDVLWLRHTSLAEDRRVVGDLLPGRAAYLLEWDERACRPRLRKLGGS
jgi:hypothetical protein